MEDIENFWSVRTQYSAVWFKSHFAKALQKLLIYK